VCVRVCVCVREREREREREEHYVYASVASPWPENTLTKSQAENAKVTDTRPCLPVADVARTFVSGRRRKRARGLLRQRRGGCLGVPLRSSASQGPKRLTREPGRFAECRCAAAIWCRCAAAACVQGARKAGWRRRRRQLLVGGAPTPNLALCGAGASGRLQSRTRPCERDARQGGFAAECAREFHAGATDLFFAVCQPPEAHC
jgi:hypothetical protein